MYADVMGDGERTMSKLLLEIKVNLEGRDIAKVYQLCDELKVNIDECHMDKTITSRIGAIASIAQPSTSNLTLNDRILEIDDLIDILNSK